MGLGPSNPKENEKQVAYLALKHWNVQIYALMEEPDMECAKTIKTSNLGPSWKGREKGLKCTQGNLLVV